MRRLIRTRPTFRHPFGKPLLCCVPWCPQWARAGWEVRDSSGALWPCCSRVHQETLTNLTEIEHAARGLVGLERTMTIRQPPTGSVNGTRH